MEIQAEYGERHKKTMAKGKRSDAERAAEHYLYEICGCDPAQIRRAVKTQFQAVDFWGCDVMGRTLDGYCYYTQVTAGQTEAVRQRRRKLGRISWNKFDRVMVLQLFSTPDPANARRKQFFFRVHKYGIVSENREWRVQDDPIVVPAAWFKKLRKD